jgi:purine-binding chemotaxis protein CheW
MLIFYLAGYEYALDVAQVQEIVRPGELRPVPDAPPWVLGLIRRRGRPVPVVDLRRRLGLPAGTRTPETCAIVAWLAQGPRAERRPVALLVDAARELLRVDPDLFQEAPPLLAGPRHPYVKAVAQLGERVLVQLDVARLFTEEEQHELGALAQPAG